MFLQRLTATPSGSAIFLTGVGAQVLLYAVIFAGTTLVDTGKVVTTASTLYGVLCLLASATTGVLGMNQAPGHPLMQPGPWLYAGLPFALIGGIALVVDYFSFDSRIERERFLGVGASGSNR